jgi:hypothetical protein
MVLAMETNTDISYYEGLTFGELDRHIATFNSIAEKRAEAAKRK